MRRYSRRGLKLHPKEVKRFEKLKSDKPVTEFIVLGGIIKGAIKGEKQPSSKWYLFEYGISKNSGIYKWIDSVGLSKWQALYAKIKLYNSNKFCKIFISVDKLT